MTDKNNPKKQNNKWLALINIPIQMGAIIFLFSYFGNWLDEKYPNPHHVFSKIMILLGVVIAFYNINRLLKEINESS
jgi:uncharacterized membrane protein